MDLFALQKTPTPQNDKILKRDGTEQSQVPAEVFQRLEQLQAKILSSALETEERVSSVVALVLCRTVPALGPTSGRSRDESVQTISTIDGKSSTAGLQSNGTVGPEEEEKPKLSLTLEGTY